jgi:CspA family cold shock protein
MYNIYSINNRMSSNDVTNTTGSSSAEQLSGRVKWFNNKQGFGFITISDGPREGTDVFVHHSAIKVSNQQYKYLVQGEYVDFTLVSSQSGAHDVQAADVCGIKGGKLMCETRRDFKMTRSSYKTSVKDGSSDSDGVSAPRSTKAPVDVETSVSSAPVRARGSGPREGGDWSVVNKRPVSGRGSGPTQTAGGRGRGRGRPPRATSNVGDEKDL